MAPVQNNSERKDIGRSVQNPLQTRGDCWHAETAVKYSDVSCMMGLYNIQAWLRDLSIVRFTCMKAQEKHPRVYGLLLHSTQRGLSATALLETGKGKSETLNSKVPPPTHTHVWYQLTPEQLVLEHSVPDNGIGTSLAVPFNGTVTSQGNAPRWCSRLYLPTWHLGQLGT